MDEELKQNLTAAETWLRGLFILLFAFLLVVARVVTGAVVVIQFLFTVFTGQTNENLRYFGASLARFIFQALMYVTYNSDSKPFPFSPWPVSEAVESETVDHEEVQETAETDAEEVSLASNESGEKKDSE